MGERCGLGGGAEEARWGSGELWSGEPEGGVIRSVVLITFEGLPGVEVVLGLVGLLFRMWLFRALLMLARGSFSVIVVCSFRFGIGLVGGELFGDWKLVLAWFLLNLETGFMMWSLVLGSTRLIS